MRDIRRGHPGDGIWQRIQRVGAVHRQLQHGWGEYPGVGGVAPVQELLPLGRGSSLSAFTATINTVNTAFLTALVRSSVRRAVPARSAGWRRLGPRHRGNGRDDDQQHGHARPVIMAASSITGTQNCNTTVRQDYGAIRSGTTSPCSTRGGTGANFHFGVTAGYLEAQDQGRDPGGAYFNPTRIMPPASSSRNSPRRRAASARPQVPFVGIYTAFTKGSFALDGQARWDFYQNSLSDAHNGLSDQRLDARGFSLTANAGYNIPLRNNWFIEPSGGVVWSRVSRSAQRGGLAAARVPVPLCPRHRDHRRYRELPRPRERAASAPTSPIGGVVPGSRSSRPACSTNSLGDVTATSVAGRQHRPR